MADHLVLKPDGLAFAPHPDAGRHRPRQVLRQRRIIDFYKRAADRPRRLLPRRLAVPPPRGARPARRHPGRLRRRAGLEPQVPRDDPASSLEGPAEDVGPIAALAGPLATTCPPPAASPTTPRGPGASGCATRRSSSAPAGPPEVKNMTVPGISNGIAAVRPLEEPPDRRQPDALRRRRGEDQAGRLGLRRAEAARALAVPRTTRRTWRGSRPTFDRFC